jgi:hypothetical protein
MDICPSYKYEAQQTRTQICLGYFLARQKPEMDSTCNKSHVMYLTGSGFSPFAGFDVSAVEM